jgi:hypothetical protein
MAAPVLASAQDARDRDRPPGQPRVILYEQADFRGGAIELGPNGFLENLARVSFDNGRNANDRISSIRIEGGAEALLYVDAGYRGEVLRVTRSIRNLDELEMPDGRHSWNDRISSVRVGYSQGGWYAFRIDPDRVIRRAYQDILLRDPDDSGFRNFRTRIIEQGWTETMVRDALRRSEEYRGPVVNKLIERAYLDLLGRRPDANGLDHYRNQIIDKGMSEEDMRNDLRRSAEYRNRGRPPSPPPANPSRRPTPAGDDRTTDAR